MKEKNKEHIFEDEVSMKNKGNYYLKVLFMALVVVIVVALLVNLLESKFQKNIKESSQYIMNEYAKCEIYYKELDYKGVCDGELMERVTSMVEFDMQLKLLGLCTDSPYAYRYAVCDELTKQAFIR